MARRRRKTEDIRNADTRQAAVAMTGVPMREALRVLLLLAALTTPLMLLAAHLWWGVLGWY